MIKVVLELLVALKKINTVRIVVSPKTKLMYTGKLFMYTLIKLGELQLFRMLKLRKKF